LTPPIYSYFE